MPPVELSTIRCQLLGDFRIVDADSREDLTPPARKTCAMIAYLALASPAPVSRERLLGLLWSDRGADQARASLRRALADLRKTTPRLSALIAAGRHALALGGGWHSDIAAIEDAVEQRDLAALATALDRNPGALLVDLEGLDRSFDDWLWGERARRHALITRSALSILGAASGTDGTAHRAILGALQLFDPGNEETARLGMQLDAQEGDLASLHRRYRLLQDQLRRDFDAAPSPATHALFRRLTAVVPVAAARAADGGARAEAAPQAPRSRSEPPIVAVVPLAALSADTAASLFARLCSDDMATALGRFRDLRILVVAEPAAEGLAAVWAQAVASYALGGSVRSAEGGYRINLRLNVIESGFVVWSRQLMIPEAGLARAVDEVVAHVAGALLPLVERHIAHQAELARDPDPAAYALYLRGRIQLLRADSHAQARGAAELFERAIAQDPNLADAHLNLARLYNTDFLQFAAGHDPAPLRTRALRLAQRAVVLDPESAHAHTRLGWCYLRAADWPRAREQFEIAVDLNPLHADKVEEAGFGMAHLGALDDAERLIRRGFELNPFPSDDYFADLGIVRALQREHARAEEQFAASRHPALHYLAARIANLAFLDRAAAAALLPSLRTAFAAIWQPAAPPADADLLGWIEIFLPLRREQDRMLLRTGLSDAGLASAQPPTRSSSSRK